MRVSSPVVMSLGFGFKCSLDNFDFKKTPRVWAIQAPFFTGIRNKHKVECFQAVYIKDNKKSLLCNKWQTVCIYDWAGNKKKKKKLGSRPGTPSDSAKLISVKTTSCTGPSTQLNIQFIPCPLNLASQICSKLFQASKSLLSERQTLTRLSVLEGWPAAAIPAPSCDSLPLPRHSATALLDVGEWVLPMGPRGSVV